METVKHTPLIESHRRLGARMTEFGGYLMPLSYAGIIEEHRAVRSAAGLFDLSHMGEFEVSGEGALELLERTLTNSAARLVDGQAQYTIMCAPDGGAIDDLIVYRRSADRYMLCVNASNITTDWNWLHEQNRGVAAISDVSEATALIAIQGPKAVEILTNTASFPITSVKRFRFADGEVAGVKCIAARTGYTGEDGFELFCDGRDGARLFEALLDAGAAAGIQPCGLGARDTLRMEAGLPLYGHELDRQTSPIEAGLHVFVKFGRDFIGENVLATHRDGAVRKRLIGLRTTDRRSIARQGYPLRKANSDIGVVTSGTFAPTFDRPLAMGFIRPQWPLKPGDKLDVVIRNRAVEAELTELPFYRRPA
jgi:aminomethyltransferase